MLWATLLIALSVTDVLWAEILACPKVFVSGNASGTGVVIGTKDGFAYLLTAAHIIGDFESVRVLFTSRDRYPKTIWEPISVEILSRWPDPDVALLRFPVGKQSVSVIALAPAWQRPKAFPVEVRTIGVGSERASTIHADRLLAREFLTREGKQLATFWKTETAPEPGRSGGPMLDVRGRVIGLAVAAQGGNGYYTHHDEILAALKRSKYGWLIPRQ